MSATQYGLLGLRKAWDLSYDEYMLELLIEQYNCGKTVYNLFKYEVQKTVTQKFNQKFGTKWSWSQLKIHYDAMKKDYGVIKSLLGHAAFRWDAKKKMVVADDTVWDSYCAVRSDVRPYRWRSFPPYDQMSIVFEEYVVGDEGLRKLQFPVRVNKALEEGNSDPETVQSSEPMKRAAQVVDEALDSDSPFQVNDIQHVKRKSTSSGFKKSIHVEAEDSIENAFYEIPSTDRFKGVQKNVKGKQPKKRKSFPLGALVEAEDITENALDEIPSAARFKAVETNVNDDRALYQRCLEEMQRIEELNDSEFTEAVNVLKDDKNAIAFMTIKGPRRLIWLRSILQG